jgi:hypothetical protein
VDRVPGEVGAPAVLACLTELFTVATDRVTAEPMHASCHIGRLAVAVTEAACVGLDQLNTDAIEAG